MARRVRLETVAQSRDSCRSTIFAPIRSGRQQLEALLAASFDFKPGENFVSIRIAPEQAELKVTGAAHGVDSRARDSDSSEAIDQRITKQLSLAHGGMQISVFGSD